MKHLKLLLQMYLGLILFTSCATVKHKDIAYLDSATTVDGLASEDIPTLNVFNPKAEIGSKLPVIIFVHGGNWNAGKKEMYGFIGRNFGKKEVITVIPGYTLSPKANYDDMSRQIAQSVKWTRTHIENYGGDPDQIYVMGHSAGGHLVALIATNPKYLGNTASDIAGVILDDAAGLDMYSYLQNFPPKESNNYATTWTKDPANWKDASPIYFLNEETPPFKIYVGLKTYASIEKYNEVFLKELQKYQPEVTPVYLNKKHVPMVTQFFWPWSDRYDEIIDFIKSDK